MSNKIITELDYYDGADLLAEGDFRISPSGMSKFFSATSKWYREGFLGEKNFESSTAAVLGTIVHYIAEQFAKEQTLSDHAREQIDLYIKKYCSIQSADYNIEVDKQIILAQYKLMAEELINSYVATHIPDEFEKFMLHDFGDGVQIGGSCDAYQNSGVVGDYKTTSAKTAPTRISYPYKVQLLTYAWLFRKRGMPANTIRLIFVNRSDIGRVSEKTGKPLKQYPSEVTIVEEVITSEDWEFIEGVIDIMHRSVLTWQNHPELRHLIAQDSRLEEGKQ
jgi:hypothetical protein